MGIRLPLRRLQRTVPAFGPLVPALMADLATFHPAAFWLLTFPGRLPPNEPQMRLNLLLAVVLTVACGAWYLLEARGRATAVGGTALAVAACAVVARTLCEWLVMWDGAWLTWSAHPAAEGPRSVIGFARAFGLGAFAWGLGSALGDVVGSRRPGTKRAGGGLASAGP